MKLDAFLEIIRDSINIGCARCLAFDACIRASLLISKGFCLITLSGLLVLLLMGFAVFCSIGTASV